MSSLQYWNHLWALSSWKVSAEAYLGSKVASCTLSLNLWKPRKSLAQCFLSAREILDGNHAHQLELRSLEHLTYWSIVICICIKCLVWTVSRKTITIVPPLHPNYQPFTVMNLTLAWTVPSQNRAGKWFPYITLCYNIRNCKFIVYHKVWAKGNSRNIFYHNHHKDEKRVIILHIYNFLLEFDYLYNLLLKFHSR